MSKLIPVLAALMLLQGCAAAVVAGGATAVTAANDRRTLGSQIDDNGIVIKARRALSQDSLTAKGSNINVTSYNGVILLAGQTPRSELKDLAAQTARGVQGVKKVYNELQVQRPASLLARSNDSLLTTKIKAQMVADSSVPSARVKVVTENGIVYLLGLVTQQEAAHAVQLIQSVSGVQRIVKLFEYIN